MPSAQRPVPLYCQSISSSRFALPSARGVWSVWRFVLPNDALAMTVPAGLRKRDAIPAWSMAAGIAIIFFGLVGYAKITRHWNTELPKQVYLQLVPNASQQYHPMPGEQ